MTTIYHWSAGDGPAAELHASLVLARAIGAWDRIIGTCVGSCASPWTGQSAGDLSALGPVAATGRAGSERKQ